MGNRPFSALISNLGRATQQPLESFGNRPKLHVVSLCDQSQDCTLNRRLVDYACQTENFSLEKGGYCIEDLATQDRFFQKARNPNFWRLLGFGASGVGSMQVQTLSLAKVQSQLGARSRVKEPRKAWGTTQIRSPSH